MIDGFYDFRGLVSILVGLIVGSFLNVVIYRLPRKKSFSFDRSQCTSCKKKINAWDNIPLISYLLLLGKCRKCKEKISMRYPIVELLTALLFYAVQKKMGWGLHLLISDWPWIALLIAITFIDLEHRLIPDVLSLPGLILGLMTSWAHAEGSWPGLTLFSSAGGALLGFLFFYSLAWLYLSMTGRHGLGGGDIKLLAMIGAFLGPSGVLATVFLSSIFGSLVGLVWAMGVKDKDLMKFSIPYGPFLVIGALYYYLLGDILWFHLVIPI